MKKQKEEIVKRVLGLTGKEKIYKAGYKNFCCLCSKKIFPNTDMLVLDKQRSWWAHTNCTVAAMTSSYSNIQLDKPTTREHKKPEEQKHKFAVNETDTLTCIYCNKQMVTGEMYVKVNGRRSRKHMHLKCYNRQKRVAYRTKMSLQ